MQQAEVERVAAPITSMHGLQRIGGGSETDVYLHDAYLYNDGHKADGQSETGDFVVKVKQLSATTAAVARQEIVDMQNVASLFVAYLGPEHSIESDFILSEDGSGRYYAIAIQPYLAAARPLVEIDYQTLAAQERSQINWQLLSLLRQSLRCYRQTGHMPDLYGTASRNIAERQRMNQPWMWPKRIWGFFNQRLWAAHNLMLTNELQPRVVLVDYDQVRWSGLWGRLYYAICQLLFWRDLIWLASHDAHAHLDTEVPHAVK